MLLVEVCVEIEIKIGRAQIGFKRRRQPRGLVEGRLTLLLVWIVLVLVLVLLLVLLLLVVEIPTLVQGHDVET